MTKSTRNGGRTKVSSATKARYFRTFLLMQQFAAEEIGARIAQARREASGMTQETLAEALDLSVRQLQNIEAGATIPWKHFNRLEAIFQKPLSWFLRGEEVTAAVDAQQLEGRIRALEDVVASGFEEAMGAIAHLADDVEALGRQLPHGDEATRGSTG